MLQIVAFLFKPSASDSGTYDADDIINARKPVSNTTTKNENLLDVNTIAVGHDKGLSIIKEEPVLLEDEEEEKQDEIYEDKEV